MSRLIRVLYRDGRAFREAWYEANHDGPLRGARSVANVLRVEIYRPNQEAAPYHCLDAYGDPQCVATLDGSTGRLKFKLRVICWARSGGALSDLPLWLFEVAGFRTGEDELRFTQYANRSLNGERLFDLQER